MSKVQIRPVNINTKLYSVLKDSMIIRLSSVYVNSSHYIPFNRLVAKELELENTLLSKLLSKSSKDSDFLRVKDSFWKEFSIDIPVDEGLLLNTTLIDKDRLNPVNINDYIKYVFALSHPLVALTKEDSSSNNQYRFYIYDEDKDEKNKNNKYNYKAEAYSEYYKIKEDVKKVYALVRLMQPDRPVESYTDEVRKNLIASSIDKDAKLFLSLIKDSNFNVKYFITEGVYRKVLDKIGESYMFFDTILGSSLKESVMFLKDPSNSKEVSKIKIAIESYTNKIMN